MRYTLSQRLTLAVVPRIAALLIRALGSTLRYEDTFAPDFNDPVRGDLIPPPTIFAFWHRSLLSCAYRFRNRNVAILISHSFDGELVARTVEHLGFYPIRGSSSRGGTAGLRNLVEAYEQGRHCAFTADGPRGPAMVAQPGPAQLAKLVQAPWIGVFYALPDRAWTLESWDRFLIPKPFSRIRMTWPAHVPTAGKSSTQLLAGVQAALDQAVTLAEKPTATR